MLYLVYWSPWLSKQIRFQHWTSAMWNWSPMNRKRHQLGRWQPTTN